MQPWTETAKHDALQPDAGVESAYTHIVYRDLRSYRYQLMYPYHVETPFRPRAEKRTPFVDLHRDGKLCIAVRYAWDGPSGPVLHTPTFMRASLIHDALYQLMRLGKLDYRANRKQADELLRIICIQDGMSAFRSWYVYLAVRIFGRAHARPSREPGREGFGPSRLKTAP